MTISVQQEDRPRGTYFHVYVDGDYRCQISLEEARDLVAILDARLKRLDAVRPLPPLEMSAKLKAAIERYTEKALDRNDDEAQGTL